MPIFTPRGQPPDGDGINGSGNGSQNSSTTDSAPGSLSNDPDDWWWSASAEAVKWGVIAGIFFLFLLCLMGAYLHAMHRIKKGVQPLAYHRWLVRRHQRARIAPQGQNHFSFYGQQDGHNMQPYATPPPAYNAEHDYVPAYSPPQEGSKIKMKDETAIASTEGGPSQPPPVANPSRPMYS